MALKLKSTKQTVPTFAKVNGALLEVGQTEVAVPDLYVRVNTVSGSKQALTALVESSDFASRNPAYSKTYTFEPKMDGGNFIAQAYQHLKGLPEFAGAEDC